MHPFASSQTGSVGRHDPAPLHAPGVPHSDAREHDVPAEMGLCTQPFRIQTSNVHGLPSSQIESGEIDARLAGSHPACRPGRSTNPNPASRRRSLPAWRDCAMDRSGHFDPVRPRALVRTLEPAEAQRGNRTSLEHAMSSPVGRIGGAASGSAPGPPYPPSQCLNRVQ